MSGVSIVVLQNVEGKSMVETMSPEFVGFIGDAYRIRYGLIDERSELCTINMALHWHRCATFTEQLDYLWFNDTLHLFQGFFL